MLKTLEEPPEHVKFILATTDPQKIPVTVLSRCLQFNLKQMPASAIASQLSKVLGLEQIPAEEGALRLIAASAHGSMRDGLSLLDQAIAYSAGNVTEAAARAMLGTVDEDFLFELLEKLAEGDAAGALQVADRMDERNVSFDVALQDLAALLHRLALARATPAAIPEDDPNRQRILQIAERFDPEEVQLDYQIAIHGRQDLPYAPDSYAGFTMALLRMIAFRPGAAREGAQPIATQSRPSSKPAAKATTQAVAGHGVALNDWPELARTLDLGGVARQLAQQCALVSFQDGLLELKLAPAFRHLAEKGYQEKLRLAIEERVGIPLRLKIEVGDTAGGSAQDRAAAAIGQDAFVRGMMDQFDATIVDSSIKPAQ
jgi:DNA polymerase-3 subunit gamma/tau